MNKSLMTLAFAAMTAIAACGGAAEDGQVEVQTPDVDVNVSTDTSTIAVPDVDVGTTQDTMIVNRPTVDVDGPNNTTPDDQKTGTGTKRP